VRWVSPAHRSHPRRPTRRSVRGPSIYRHRGAWYYRWRTNVGDTPGDTMTIDAPGGHVRRQVAGQRSSPERGVHSCHVGLEGRTLTGSASGRCHQEEHRAERYKGRMTTSASRVPSALIRMISILRRRFWGDHRLAHEKQSEAWSRMTEQAWWVFALGLIGLV
jgi:hypothetical protein